MSKSVCLSNIMLSFIIYIRFKLLNMTTKIEHNLRTGLNYAPNIGLK
jgi:hypothetical protein